MNPPSREGCRLLRLTCRTSLHWFHYDYRPVQQITTARKRWHAQWRRWLIANQNGGAESTFRCLTAGERQSQQGACGSCSCNFKLIWVTTTVNKRLAGREPFSRLQRNRPDVTVFLLIPNGKRNAKVVLEDRWNPSFDSTCTADPTVDATHPAWQSLQTAKWQNNPSSQSVSLDVKDPASFSGYPGVGKVVALRTGYRRLTCGFDYKVFKSWVQRVRSRLALAGSICMWVIFATAVHLVRIETNQSVFSLWMVLLLSAQSLRPIFFSFHDRIVAFSCSF